jgi:hypothetical protein
MTPNIIGLTAGVALACVIWFTDWVAGSIRIMEKCDE